MISEKEYKKRRKNILKKLKNNSVAVLFSATSKVRTNDTHYQYRQNSNFYYLTGFEEENSCLVFIKTKDLSKIYMFVSKKDKVDELWNGKKLGVKKAKRRFLVDDIFEYNLFNEKFKEYLVDKKNLYYDFKNFHLKNDFTQLYKIYNISKDIELMRLIKSKSEIKLIKKAISITKEAHHKAIKKVSTLKYEYELQAEFEYIFKSYGAYSDAYTSIVACGNSANTLHYIKNDKKLKKGKLILIDAGCEYKNYASDITRTIPVDGKFSKPQAKLYNMVLDVEKEIISMVKSGILRSDLQKKSEELLAKGMIKLKILDGDVKNILKKKLHKKYFMHGIGHWMGLDVHDEAPYKDKDFKEIPLKSGMVLTIEPAIYIDKDDKSVPAEYRGIGIRIEDDILVTETGYENLSYEIVKEIEDIEKVYSLDN